MKIIRVFPRQVKSATPTDEGVRIGTPPGLFDTADEVHVSVAFTWDKPYAETLAEAWQIVAPVKVGGPAYGQPSGEFVPGQYLKLGWVITSRGCPNHCWFCSVWKREPALIELPIRDGWNVADDNLLACSESHIKAVFAMLARQKHRPRFTGGLEARLLKQWHADAIADLRPQTLYFAYDTPDDWEPLPEAMAMFQRAGISSAAHKIGCYILCGYPGDSLADACDRIERVRSIGLMPFAMLYRGIDGKTATEWRQWTRQNNRPRIVFSNGKQKST